MGDIKRKRKIKVYKLIVSRQRMLGIAKQSISLFHRFGCKDIGFEVGTPLKVECDGGKLTITISNIIIE